MRYYGKEKTKFIRILIGNSETGNTGFKAPIKSIRLIETTVEEIFKIIKEALDKKVK